jgi:hypothetical protein
MPTPDSIAGDIITAATFMSGLVLLYLQSLVAHYTSYDATQQGAVKGSHQARGWLAFFAFICSGITVGLALGSEWTDDSVLLWWSVGFLGVVFASGVIAALMMVLEIA